MSIGFQRNRESAQLLAYREKGKDRLAQEVPKFEQRTSSRPRRFHEANEFSDVGDPLNYWQADRESSSKILLAIHEIEALPDKAQAPAPGETWKSGSLLGLEFRFLGMESLSGKQCAKVEGDSTTAHLYYWWCPDSGVLGKIQFEGEYSLPGDATAHERLSFELQRKTRAETLSTWLNAVDTQQGALDALLLSPWVIVPSELLVPVTQSSEPRSQAMALAILIQRGLALPKELADKLSQRQNPEIARMARQLSGTTPPMPNHEPASSRYPPQRPGTSVRIMQAPQYRGTPYMLHVPANYRGDRPFPLFIYLSGGPGLAIDAVNTAEDVIGPSEYLGLYPQAGDLWWKPQVRDRFNALLEEVLQQLNVDHHRIYIAGFSNGGTGALYFATLWPQRFTAVVSLMGAGTCIDEIANQLRAIRDLPVLFVHGDKDPTIPDRCSRDTYEALKKLSPTLRSQLHILKGREHDITLQNDEGLTLQFLADVSGPKSP